MHQQALQRRAAMPRRTNGRDAQSIKINAQRNKLIQDAKGVGHIVNLAGLRQTTACSGIEGA